MKPNLDIAILGLTVTSSWGNGHATTYRSLIRGLAARGHRITFLERDLPWYAGNRDSPRVPGATVHLYNELEELYRFEELVRAADLVIVGSYVPEGVRVGQWVTAVADGLAVFYDIDTPVTVAKLRSGEEEYVSRELIRRYDAYWSFTGGPVLRTLESEFGAPIAQALYCSVDTTHYHPVSTPYCWQLGYLGTYSEDRQPALDELLLGPARLWPEERFVVAGPQYPKTIVWPPNIARTIHLSPREHAEFYGSQRFTLNITRQAMKRAGYSPSVRLFEAAACGAAIVSDEWDGLDRMFRPEYEILIAETAEDVMRILRDVPEERRRSIAGRARQRVLAEHTAERRASEVECFVKAITDNRIPLRRVSPGSPEEVNVPKRLTV
jgi:spore maturation protein CgeB